VKWQNGKANGKAKRKIQAGQNRYGTGGRTVPAKTRMGIGRIMTKMQGFSRRAARRTRGA